MIAARRADLLREKLGQVDKLAGLIEAHELQLVELARELNLAQRAYLLAAGWEDVTNGARRLMFAPPADREGAPWAEGGIRRVYRTAWEAVELERKFSAGGAE